MTTEEKIYNFLNDSRGITLARIEKFSSKLEVETSSAEIKILQRIIEYDENNLMHLDKMIALIGKYLQKS